MTLIYFVQIQVCMSCKILLKLSIWFSVNRLSLNLEELELKINNVVLPRVTATKFLGIIIDGNRIYTISVSQGTN